MSFAETIASHVRLAILLTTVESPREMRLRLTALLTLLKLPQKSATISLLSDLMSVSREEITAEIAWMDRSKLVSFSDGTPARVVCMDMGLDVAMGRMTCPGIATMITIDYLHHHLQGLALSVSMADLEAHIAFLTQERCVIRTSEVVEITQRGLDVVTGRCSVNGIKSPSMSTIMTLAADAAKNKMAV